MKTTVKGLTLLGIVALILAGCTANTVSIPTPTPAPTSSPTAPPSPEPPTREVAPTNTSTNTPLPTVTQPAAPLAVAAGDSTTGDATKGRSVYTATCARCHGRYAELVVGHNRRALSDPKTYQAFTEAEITDLIVNGNKEMPAFSRYLSKKELADLLAYLYTFAPG